MKLIVLGSILVGYFFEVNTEFAFEKVFDSLHKPPPLPEITSRTIVETKWIKQKLDNFNKSDNRAWSMRYMANSNYFKDGGPIFIYVGGEWEISSGYIQGGHMFDIAKGLNGYLFYTEHRYYGASHPTPDLSNKNLKYLNVDQALADLAHFITTMKKTIPGLKNSGVILVGGSYSATMVTWFREIYPELSCGAWASSAPVLAKIDFLEYKEVTGQSIKIVGGQQCYDRIQRGFQEMEELLQNNQSELLKVVRSCDNLDLSNQLNVWSMFSSLSGVFAGLVQGHRSGDIEKACKIILAEKNNTDGLSAYFKKYFGIKNNCVNYSYNSSVKQLSSTKNKNSQMRQWIYQTCTEFGWYQTSASKAQPFGTKFPVDYYIELCKDVYGSRYTSEFIHRNAIKTNSKYGGMEPNVTNVFFTNGQLDPWRAMGIQKDLNQYAEANVVPLYAHCQDFGSLDKSKDTNELQASKESVKTHIYQWLGIKQ